MFNTAPITGTNCRVVKNGVAIDFTTEWSISVQAELSPATSQGDLWHSFTVGQLSWRGNVRCLFTPGNTLHMELFENIVGALPGTEISNIQFCFGDEENYFIGSLIISGFISSADVVTAVVCEFPFVGNGELYQMVSFLWEDVIWEDVIWWN